MTFKNWTADQLLQISTLGELFTQDLRTVHSEYKQLVLHWHPDKNTDPRATEVFMHVTNLYHRAIKILENGEMWEQPNIIDITDGHKRWKFHFRRRHELELGVMYIGQQNIAFVLQKEYEDLFDNAINNIRSLKFSSAEMQKEVSRYLPQIKQIIKGPNEVVLVISKDKELVLLHDVLNHFGGKLDARNVAWIMSTLYNLTCYLQFTGVAHNDISPMTYFVSPPNHYGALLGGWWYSAQLGKKVLAVNRRTHDIMRYSVGNVRIDAELIRMTGREILGPDAPTVLSTWLNFAGSGNPVVDYKTWNEKILPESFGPKKFTELKIQAEEVY